MNNINYEYIEEVVQREANTFYGVYDDDGQFIVPFSEELANALMPLPAEERIAYLQRYIEIIRQRTMQLRRPRKMQIALKE